eukprot:7271858-Karenia_brevis.AAC.1
MQPTGHPGYLHWGFIQCAELEEDSLPSSREVKCARIAVKYGDKVDFTIDRSRSPFGRRYEGVLKRLGKHYCSKEQSIHTGLQYSKA